MACDYCNGSRKTLPLDNFATSDDFFIVEACLEGVDEAYPSLTVNADGALICVQADYCIKCGAKLGDTHEE